MHASSLVSVVGVIYLALGMAVAPCAAQSEPVLPQGVKAIWDLEKAFREATPTRERISINGLWRWQPAGDAADAVPTGGWGSPRRAPAAGGGGGNSLKVVLVPAG